MLVEHNLADFSPLSVQYYLCSLVYTSLASLTYRTASIQVQIATKYRLLPQTEALQDLRDVA